MSPISKIGHSATKSGARGQSRRGAQPVHEMRPRRRSVPNTHPAHAGRDRHHAGSNPVSVASRPPPSRGDENRRESSHRTILPRSEARFRRGRLTAESSIRSAEIPLTRASVRECPRGRARVGLNASRWFRYLSLRGQLPTRFLRTADQGGEPIGIHLCEGRRGANDHGPSSRRKHAPSSFSAGCIADGGPYGIRILPSESQSIRAARSTPCNAG